MKKYLIAVFTTLALSFSSLSLVHASPASCLATNVRWAGSSNILYVDGPATICTPADLSAMRPSQVVSLGSNVYLLKTNLKLTNGATLQTVGTAAGGDTNELRLMSNSSAFVNIVADWGKVVISNTKVQSWDEALGAPSTKITNGRAYIDVRSRYVNGVALQSRMDITSSDVGYLGYDYAESYGLVWKVEGATATDKTVFNHVDVLGDVTGSRLHNNYFGLYTFGAYGMRIDNNETDHNIKYGIDTHDDSDALVITNNRTHDNGDHGIICSQRCDHLTISGNDSYNNVGHGIMLHRSTDYTNVENNTVSSNTQAGIALFESNNNTVRGNVVVGNPYGIRLSVGSSFNTFDSNTVDKSTSYGIYTYQGSDAPERPGNNGINSRNVWTGNIVSHSASKIMKLRATDHDMFTGNDFRNNSGVGFDLSGATSTTYTNNKTDPGATLH